MLTLLDSTRFQAAAKEMGFMRATQAHVYLSTIRDMMYDRDEYDPTWVSTTKLKERLMLMGWSRQSWRKLRRTLVKHGLIEESANWVRVAPGIPMGHTLKSSYDLVRLRIERRRNARDKNSLEGQKRLARKAGRAKSPFGKPGLPRPLNRK